MREISDCADLQAASAHASLPPNMAESDFIAPPSRRPVLPDGRGQGTLFTRVTRAFPVPVPVRVLPVALLGGCGGAQSAISAAGEDAAAITTLFVVLLALVCVLWLLLNGAFFLVWHVFPGKFAAHHARRVLIGGGIVLPTVVLVPLLAWGLTLLPDQRQPGDGLVIRVTGEQWWWRVEYRREGQEPVVSANEIRLPQGQRVEFILDSDRVIHSFWIPSLGGKMDMFPGRETRMSLRATQTGTFRGQCAEFCGASHAWMAFEAVVMPEAEFDDWLSAQAGPARAPEADAAKRGAALFQTEGCGACHTVRGTEAVGQVGPDLTHVGSRQTLGAGRLGTSLEDYATWLEHTDDLKPEVRMPTYDSLSPDEVADLSHYLKGLQ
jgi:cytochrome c oxidase subunit II